MEPSSDQNSEENDNNPLPQSSQEVETDTEKNSPVKSSESQESNNPINGMKATDNETATGSESPLVGSSEETNVITSERSLNKMPKTSMRKLMDISRKFETIFSYQARGRPRQPFMNQGQHPPPAYYTTQNQTRQPQRVQPQRQESSREQPQEPQRKKTEQTQSTGEFYLRISNWSPYFGHSRGFQWATYPARIPDRVPGSLALLVDAEAIFIMQQLNLIEFLTDIPEPNLYLVLNKQGECLYYVYETFGCLEHCCCGNTRGFQLHVMDVYENEVIFMKRTCGSPYFFCCYPVMEIYSPPMVPIGAVTKSYTCCRENFNVVDPDENVIFKINGGPTVALFCGAGSIDLTVHALDPQSTVVGLIRREFISYLNNITNVDYYGISFPKDMDVRLKAVFLGAAFLFDFMYFE